MDHQQHQCDRSLSCPMKCQLCSSYCAVGDHFHALKPDAIHLCGYVRQYITEPLLTLTVRCIIANNIANWMGFARLRRHRNRSNQLLWASTLPFNIRRCLFLWSFDLYDTDRSITCSTHRKAGNSLALSPLLQTNSNTMVAMFTRGTMTHFIIARSAASIVDIIAHCH